MATAADSCCVDICPPDGEGMKNCENCANGWERTVHGKKSSWLVYGCPFLSRCDCSGVVFPDHWKAKVEEAKP